MAEELDEFGVPIKRKPTNNGELDEFGVPIKKKAQSVTSSSGVATRGTTSANPLLKASQPSNFNFAESVNPELQQTIQQQEQATSNRLNQLNQVYDASQGDNASQAIQTQRTALDAPALGALESIKNSGSNFVNRLQGTIPRLNVVAADAFDYAFGKELTKKIYEFEGRDVDQVRNEALAELQQLAAEVKPTLGIVGAIENNSMKQLSAGLVNTITSLGSTIVPSVATAGAGLFTEMMGDSLVDFNEAKAKRLGKPVSQLYADDQAEFEIPAMIGTLGGAMELIGLKGVTNLINKEIKGTALKKGLIYFGESQKEGLTELMQTGLEAANRRLGEGGNEEDAGKAFKDAIFSKQGLESYLQGVVGASGVAGIANISNTLSSPKAKSSLKDEVASINMIEMELAKPEVSEQAKQVLAEQIRPAISRVADIVEADEKALDGLSKEQRKRVGEVNTEINRLDTVIDDANISDGVKKPLIEQRDALVQEAEAIVPETEERVTVKKGTDVGIDDTVELVNGRTGVVQKVEGNQITMKMENGSTFMATPDMVEMSVVRPIEALVETKAPELVETPIEVNETIVEPVIESNETPTEIVTEEVVPEAEVVPTEAVQEALDALVLKKAEDDLTALKKVTNKVQKYQASVKRLNEAYKAGNISQAQFEETKQRFDDVITDSDVSVPKITNLTPQETQELDNELKNENLTTNDFIQYERARAIEDISNATEAVQESSDDNGGSTTEVEASETAQSAVREKVASNKVKVIQEKRQSIKDRISQKLKDQRGQLNSGFDASLISDFVELGATYVEEGIVNATDFIKRFREDYKDLGFDDSEISDEQITQEIFSPNQKQETSEKFYKLAHKNIQSDEVSNTLNNVERETGRELSQEEKEYRVTKRTEAVNYGFDVVEAAKEEYGDRYVTELLRFLDENARTLSIENKALITISLELDLERQLQENPTDITLNKQLKLVRDVSTRQQRSAAIATGYGILRQIARVGYDISQVTDQFFTDQQLEDRRKLAKAVESTPDDINKEADIQEGAINVTDDVKVTPKKRKPRLGLSESQKAEKAALAREFRGVFNDVTRIATLLADKKFMRYAKLVLLDTAGDFESFAVSMIENVGEGIREHLPRIYQKIGGTDEVKPLTEAQKAKKSTVKEIVKKALIDKGYGREITVTLTERDADGKAVLNDKGITQKVKEKRQVIDWKKLAGEEGSVDNIRNNVEASLREEGYSDADINNIQTELVDEYNRLHASIIEKSIRELETRNKERDPIDTKTSARRLAELYNYGLFEEQSDTYDNIVNNAIGLNKIGQEAFNDAKKLAKSLSDLYRSTDANGRRITEFGLKEAIRNINTQIEDLLSKVAWEQSNKAFKIATVTKEYMNFAQRAMLQTMKQIVENPLSGSIQRLFTILGYINDADSKDLRVARRLNSLVVYEDIVRNGGLTYGEITTPLVNKSKLEEKLNKVSDSKLYHTAISGLLGRAYLDGADSMHKTALTERYFVHNLVRVLQQKGMGKQEAIDYVSAQLTGQRFNDALGTAKSIIDATNDRAGKKILPDNPQAVFRLATNIVKDALVVGDNITLREVEASYQAAYKAAGYDLGHEANNLVSAMIGSASTKIENAIKLAVKEKKWNRATSLTMMSILNKNILNPFVGGGTNWMVLTLQKAGVDIISPLVDYTNRRDNPLDITTQTGVKNMENALLANLRFKNTANRVIIGAMASALVATAVISSGADEDLNDWLKKNEWARKYFDVISPQALVLLVTLENKEVGDYIAKLMGIKYDSYSDGKKLYQGITGVIDDSRNKQNKGWAKLGEVVGGHTSFPGPWRVARDLENIARQTQGQKPRKSAPGGKGFASGYFRGGLIDYLGFRPMGKNGQPLNDKDTDDVINQALDFLNQNK